MDAGSSSRATLNNGSDAALRSLNTLGSNLSVNKPLSISTIFGSIEAKVSSMLIPSEYNPATCNIFFCFRVIWSKGVPPS